MKTRFLHLLIISIGLFISSCATKTNGPAPVASFKDSVNGYSVTFTSTSSNSPTTLTWDFGDSTPTQTGNNITHKYAKIGDYTVTLTAKNNGGSNSSKATLSLVGQVMKIHTKFGDMYMWLYDEMPDYQANFIHNVTTHLYDSTTFHRCVPNFVIQGGDSLSKGVDQSTAGTGGPDKLPFRVVPGITHIYGAVGAASLGAMKPGNNWQFYIVTNKSGDHSLDGSYAVYGYIIKGMDVALTIQSQPQDANNKPLTPIRMSVTMIPETKSQILTDFGYVVK